MKKLLSIFVALALLLGLASCSGDLHDAELPKTEPITISGASWYYTDITIWGDNDSTDETNRIGIIVNNNTSPQSTNTYVPDFEAKTGAVFYYTADYNVASASDATRFDLNTSYQTDEPTYTTEAGKVRIYVYTNVASPYLHYWGGVLKDTVWPGTPMAKVGETAASSYSMTIKNVIVKNLPDALNNKKLYYRGGLVDAGWATVEANSATVTNKTITVPVNKTDTKNSSTGYASSSEFKIADSSWGVSIGKGFGSDNDAGNVSVLIVDGATVNIVGYYVETNSERTDKYSCVWYLESAE